MKRKIPHGDDGNSSQPSKKSKRCCCQKYAK
jgi:hypothetical protein